MSDEIIELSGVALSSAIRNRELSCIEVCDAFLKRVDQENGKLNAIVAMPDREHIRREAHALDLRLSKGDYLGPMHGLPQAPKDFLPLSGFATTKGSRAFADNVPTTDAVSFERLRKGGAVFIGRSNCPEFGLGGHTYNAVYGMTKNPWDDQRSAGGSSGGAAVAVVSRMLPLADGTDMMGSLRTPASFNNVFGFRTSLGRVPHGPADDIFFQQFSVSGPMARNVPDLAMWLSVAAGFDSRLPLSNASPADMFAAPLERDFAGIKIGWLGNLSGRLAMEKEAMQICETSLAHFTSLGCHVEAVDSTVIGFDLERLWQAFLTLRGFLNAGNLGALYDDPVRRQTLKAEAIWEINEGRKLSAGQVFRATCDRSAWYQAVRSVFDQYDFLVMPATQTLPFPSELPWPNQIDGVEMDTYHRWMETSVFATMAGLPAISAPAGFSQSGLPVGIQIMGPAQQDFQLLQLAHAYDLQSGYAKILPN